MDYASSYWSSGQTWLCHLAKIGHTPTHEQMTNICLHYVEEKWALFILLSLCSIAWTTSTLINNFVVMKRATSFLSIIITFFFSFDPNLLLYTLSSIEPWSSPGQVINEGQGCLLLWAESFSVLNHGLITKRWFLCSYPFMILWVTVWSVKNPFAHFTL